MKKNFNWFVAINVLCILIFVSSLFGVFDWALASVILIVGVGLSTFLGTLYYSERVIQGSLYRVVFSVGVVSTGYVFLKVGEYLNQNVYDGLVTLSVIAYVLLATALLHCLGRRSL